MLGASENDNLGFCSECRYTFCKRCKKLYHGSTLCEDQWKLIEAQEKYRKLQMKLKALGIGESDMKRMFQEMLAAAKIECTTRLCPNDQCRVPIEKNMGCSHMYCTRCRTHFNWEDAKEQETDIRALVEKYDSDFAKVEKALNQETQRMTLADLEGKPSATANLEVTSIWLKRVKPCPNPSCKKLNMKFGTRNYLICEHCKRGFCFSCGRTVLNERSHFGHACKRYG